MLAEGSTDLDVADSTTIGKLALRQDRNAWISELNGSNDDAGVSAPACVMSLESPDWTDIVMRRGSGWCFPC